MSPRRRAIISITPASAPLHGDHLTGVFISEALRPFNVSKAAGFKVDIVSEKGTWTPDWLSIQPDFLPDEERKQYEDTDGEFRKKSDSGLTRDKVDASEVCSIEFCPLNAWANIYSTASSSPLPAMLL